MYFGREGRVTSRAPYRGRTLSYKGPPPSSVPGLVALNASPPLYTIRRNPIKASARYRPSNVPSFLPLSRFPTTRSFPHRSIVVRANPAHSDIVRLIWKRQHFERRNTIYILRRKIIREESVRFSRDGEVALSSRTDA